MVVELQLVVKKLGYGDFSDDLDLHAIHAARSARTGQRLLTYQEL
jgi:hypothetical protein